jgi:integrase
MVQRFVSVASRKSAPKTVRNFCVTLQSMGRSARAWRYVKDDIFEGVVLPRPQHVQRFFFSAEEVQRIILAAKEPRRTFYGLLAETGLRVGELCGLTVDALDLKRGVRIVRQSAWRGKLGSPKTAESVRVVDLSPECVANLNTFLKAWRPNDKRLLFATRNGTPWDANLVLRRNFKLLLRKLGITCPLGNGFHAFRHANETLMDRFGVPLKVRQNRLGHTDSRLTLGVYTHVAGEDAKRAASQLGSVVWGRNLEIFSDANGRENENGLEAVTPKPFQIN